jgi:hypothetical protein
MLLLPGAARRIIVIVCRANAVNSFRRIESDVWIAIFTISVIEGSFSFQMDKRICLL